MRKVQVGGQEFLANVYPNPPLDKENKPETHTSLFVGGDIPDDDAYMLECDVSADDICNAIGPQGRRFLR